MDHLKFETKSSVLRIAFFASVGDTFNSFHCEITFLAGCLPLDEAAPSLSL